MKVIKQHIIIPDQPELATLPNTKRAKVEGVDVVAIPHTLDAVRLLRNMNIAAPSPIHYGYNWCGPYTPMRHQRITADMCTVYRRMFVLNGMGTGKTLAVLWAIDYLIRAKQVNRVLIISPRSTLKDVWGSTIFLNFPHLSHDILRGSPSVCKEKLAKRARICILNAESVRVRAELLRGQFDMVVIDELAQVARNKTGAYKAIKTLTDTATWVWGMTGTPTPNEPTDAYHQIELIRPKSTGVSYGTFRDMVMRKVTQFKWEPREGAEEIVAKYMRPCVRFRTEDCIDLPPVSYIDLTVDLTDEQRKHHKQLLDESCTEVKGVNITAVNAAVLANKLIQAACGAIYGEDKQVALLDVKPRYDAIREIIDACDEKVIVFVPFTSVIGVLLSQLKTDGYGVSVIDGSVSDAARSKIFSNFRTKSRRDAQIILAHPRAMSHGINLEVASTVIWYAPYASNETYEQANARIKRPGQKNHMTIVRISATSVERKVYKSLEEKGRLQQAILDLLTGHHGEE